MNDTDLESLPEPMRQLIHRMAAAPSGSVFRENGKPVVRVVPVSTNGTPDDWTDAKNDRRCNLIRKKFSNGLDPAEARELAALQEEITIYRKHIVRLPYDAVDALEAALNPPASAP